MNLKSTKRQALLRFDNGGEGKVSTEKCRVRLKKKKTKRTDVKQAVRMAVKKKF